MAITISNNSGAPQQADRVATTCTINLTGVGSGDAVVVLCSWRDTGSHTITGVDISGEAASAQTLQIDAASESRQQIWTLASVTGSGSKTVTVTFSGSGLGVCYAASLAGADSGALVDDLQNITGTGTTATGTVTTEAAGAAIFAILTAGTVINGAGSNYTLINLSNYWTFHDGEYDLDAGAAGSKTVDFPLFESAVYAYSAIALKPAAPVAGPVVAWIRA